MDWLQKIIDRATVYSEITSDVFSITLPTGANFTFATDGHVLVAYQAKSDNEPVPDWSGGEALRQMLERRTGVEVRFSDLYEWMMAGLWHNCPYCAGTGLRMALRFDDHEMGPLETDQVSLPGFLLGQCIDRRILHLPLNHLKAETVTIATVEGIEHKRANKGYYPIQIHCAEWILCVMPMAINPGDYANTPVFPG